MVGAYPWDIETMLDRLGEDRPQIWGHLFGHVWAGAKAVYSGTQYDHVKRDIETMLGGIGEGATKFGGTYLDSQGKERAMYILDRRHALCLASGYDVAICMCITDLHDKLQAQASQLNPNLRQGGKGWATHE